MIVALIPLAFVVDFALIYASVPDALRYVGVIDVPVFVVILVAWILSQRRKTILVEQKAVLQTTALDKLRERNGGRRAPVTSAKSILDKDEKNEAEVFLETPDVEKRVQAVDETLQRMKARELTLGSGPDPEVEARPQPIIVESEPSAIRLMLEPETKPKGKSKNYVLTPDKLKVPAFVCRCGHPHRFVCLTCGLTAEQAVKKGKTHWVEWVPEMGALP